MKVFTPRTQLAPPRDVNDLLTRVGAGDERAFAALYDHGAATVHGLALRVLRDPVLAAEVTQAVWVRVWHSASRYTPDEGSAMAWVMSLAHRAVVERIRSAPPRTQATPHESVRTEPGPGAHLTNAAQRRAVLLAYYRGRTSEQISTLLGIPRETVATMIHSGLLHLRAQLRIAGDRAAGPDALNTAVDAKGR